jgi:outer membrane protein TolC
MKKTVLTALAVIALAMPVFSEKRMSRNDVLKHAFENSDGLAQIKAEREKTELQIREIRGGAFPDINGAVNYVHAPNLNGEQESGGSIIDAMKTSDKITPGDANSADYFLGGAMDGALEKLGGALSAMNAKNTLQWEVSLTQPIFVQGKIKTGLRIADIVLEMVDEQYKDAQFSLAQQVIDAYNGALMAQQNLLIQRDALVIAEESHRLSLARFHTGKGSALDTLNTRFAIQKAHLNLREAEKGQRLSIKSLANAANIADDNFSLSDTLTIPQFNMSEEAAWEEMQKNNSSLKLLSQTRALKSEQTHLAKTDYRPLLAAFANIGQVNLFETGDDLSTLDNWNWRSQIGLSLKMPIWNGGQRRSKLNQAKVEELKVERQEAQATSGLRLALAAAFEDLAVAKEELSQTEQMLILAEQGYKISKLSFEIGQLTQLELNNAEQMLRMAKLAQNAAVFKINTAVVNIEKLIGNENLISVRN